MGWTQTLDTLQIKTSLTILSRTTENEIVKSKYENVLLLLSIDVRTFYRMFWSSTWELTYQLGKLTPNYLTTNTGRLKGVLLE